MAAMPSRPRVFTSMSVLLLCRHCAACTVPPISTRSGTQLACVIRARLRDFIRPPAGLRAEVGGVRQDVVHGHGVVVLPVQAAVAGHLCNSLRHWPLLAGLRGEHRVDGVCVRSPVLGVCEPCVQGVDEQRCVPDGRASRRCLSLRLFAQRDCNAGSCTLCPWRTSLLVDLDDRGVADRLGLSFDDHLRRRLFGPHVLCSSRRFTSPMVLLVHGGCLPRPVRARVRYR